MKELSLYPGGHPFTIEDIAYLQSGIKDTLSELCRTWIKYLASHSYSDSTDVLILRGIKAIPSTYNITEGWAFIGGDICYSPAWSRPEASNWDLWGLVKAPAIYDVNGDKVYADGSTKHTYSNYRAEWKLIASIPSGTQYIPLVEVITGSFGLFDVKIPVLPVPDQVTLINSSAGVIYAHRINGIVTITGKVLNANLSGTVIASLPSGWGSTTSTLYFHIPTQVVGDYVILKITGLSLNFTAVGFTNPSVDGSEVAFSVSFAQ